MHIFLHFAMTAMLKKWFYSKPSRHGFSLTEMAVVLGIVATVMGVTVTVGMVRLDTQKIETTDSRLAMIEDALRVFAERNLRLPCPADGELPKTDANYGVEADTPGTCTGGAVAANFNSGNAVGGVLPVKALNLPSEMMYDAWGRRFSYAADKRYTATDAFSKYKRSSAGLNGLEVTVKQGALSNVISNAIYVLVSHGQNGHGAFFDTFDAPYKLDVSATNTDELDNASVDGAFADDFDNVFVVREAFEDPSNINERFDDLVRFKSRSELVLASDLENTRFAQNQAAPAGWVYIPETKLVIDQGTGETVTVPAFEIMKYEASDSDADSIPASVSGQTPKASVTPIQARQYCQRLNNYATATGFGPIREYDIPTETQWLAIAKQLAENDQNWLNGLYGEGQLMAGHVDNDPASSLAASSDDSDGYYDKPAGYDDPDTSPDDERRQRRTFFLPNGSAIWDFGGNLGEYTYCDIVPAGGTSLCHNPSPANEDIGATNANIYYNAQIGDASDHDYSDLAADGVIDVLLPSSDLGDSHGIGSVQGSGTGASPTGNSNYIIRGTTYDSAALPNLQRGFYRTSASASVSSSSASVGFRCVHNLTATAYEKTNEEESASKFHPTMVEGLIMWFDAADLDGDGNEEDAAEANLTSGGGCAETDGLEDDGCIAQWHNKLQTTASHPYEDFTKSISTDVAKTLPTFAESGKIGGAASGNDINKPTLDLDGGPNGYPAIRFDHGERTANQFERLEIAWNWHTGRGAVTEMTVILVINATNYWNFFRISNEVSLYVDSATAILQNGADTWPSNWSPYFTRSYNTTNNICINPFGFWLGCADAGGRTNISDYSLNSSRWQIATTRAQGVTSGTAVNGLCHFVNGLGHKTATEDRSCANWGPNWGTPSMPLVPNHNYILLGNTSAVSAENPLGHFKISEMLIYERALSQKERALVETWLAEKYHLPYRGPKP